MSAALQLVPVPLVADVDTVAIDVPVASLRTGLSPRLGGPKRRHVEALTEVHESWPPLVVQRSTMTVIDGVHRLSAAKLMGLARVRVEFFDGDDESAGLEAIRLNLDHGLPLTLAERKRAAGLVLRQHPGWSDRAVGHLCALSAGTVAQVRRTGVEDVPRPSVEAAPLDRRIGRDGRARPVDPKALRARIAAALDDEPDASLRTIAARTGASPETVRSVRRERADDDGGGTAAPWEVLAGLRERRAAALQPGPRFTSDTACGAPEAAGFAAWFDGHAVDAAEVEAYAEAVPLSRVYEVADEVRRRMAVWEAFAQRLQARPARSR